MKKLNIIKYLVAFVFAFNLMFACEEADSEEDFGFPLIYMPQATIFSGGSNNNYPVPGGNETNQNYLISGNNLEIILGVYRAGLQDLEAFSVEVFNDADTANQIVTNNYIAGGVLLPDDLYSFPQSVSVGGDSREAIFKLVIDGVKLNSDYPGLAGSKLIVAIGLRNPSKFELNRELSTTIVVINADDFMPFE